MRALDSAASLNHIEIPLDGFAIERRLAIACSHRLAVADYAGCYSNYMLEAAGCLHSMLDQTTKFLGRAEGTQLIARGRVVTSGRTNMVGACDIFVLRGGGEYLVATALLTTHHGESHNAPSTV